jgi:crotonobetainyl-CoA:carnitine CoA-transferase CaiB-like acyl-CoA transferase
MKPLESLRILDLTHILAGPYCTMLLADLGAEIIKIEPPGGEATRALLANDPKNSLHGMGAYSLTLNRNKKSMVVDLKTEAGLALFYDLVRVSDVVVNNLAPGTPEKLKIDHARLCRINSRLVTCSITGFGETGPHPNRPAFDQITQGMGGGMSITGRPDGPPTRAGIPIGDLGGGAFATIGILSALMARERDGCGRHVDLGMVDVQISLLNYMATMFFLSGENPGRIGNTHFVHVPYNTFATADRWIIIAMVANETWPNVVAAFDIEGLRDPAYLTRAGRWEHRDAINAAIQQELLKRNADAWLNILGRHGVPCAPVNDFEHALNDDQVRARNMIVRVAHPKGGSVEMPGNPIKVSDMEESFAPPPELAQDTDAVLRDILHRSAQEIAGLRAAGAVQ